MLTQVTDQTLATQATYSNLLSDLGFFHEEIRGFNNNWHHEQWCGILDNSIRQEGRKLVYLEDHSADNRWIIGLAPRGHAKSTVFTVSYPLWEIARDQNVRIVICSENATQSRAFLREITTEIENNTEYKKWFGELKPEIPDKWTDVEIIVKRTATDLKDATVATTSVGGSVLGRRADIIICDDILSYENTRTAEQRAKVREWFMTVLVPVLNPNGRLIIVGTSWTTEDLYHELLGQAGFQIKFAYDAERGRKDGEVLWPDRFSREALDKLKSLQGTLAYNRSYRNMAHNAEDAIFKVAWLNEAKKKGLNRKLLHEFKYESWDLGRMIITAGMDLAISKETTADESAIAVIGETRSGLKLPLYLDKGKWSPAEQRRRVIEVHENFHPERFVVESNQYQAALSHDLIEDTSIPIVPYNTGGEKFDEHVGINSMAVGFENGKWILPYDKDDPRTIALIDALVTGMLAFPSGHTADILMALWFANTGLRAVRLPDPKNTPKPATQRKSSWTPR